MPSGLALSLKESPEKLYGDFPDLILRQAGTKTAITKMARAIDPITTPAIVPPERSVGLSLEVGEGAKIVVLADDVAAVEWEVSSVEAEASVLVIVAPGGILSPGLKTKVEFAAASFCM